MTSEAAFQQMARPNRIVVKILEKNWPRIRESCNYHEKGKKCPLTNEDCKFVFCPLLEENKEGKNNEEKNSR